MFRRWCGHRLTGIVAGIRHALRDRHAVCLVHAVIDRLVVWHRHGHTVAIRLAI